MTWVELGEVSFNEFRGKKNDENFSILGDSFVCEWILIHVEDFKTLIHIFHLI